MGKSIEALRWYMGTILLVLLPALATAANGDKSEKYNLAQSGYYRHDLQIENDRLQSELEKERDRLKDMERQLGKEREQYRFEQEALKRKEWQKKNEDLLIRGIY